MIAADARTVPWLWRGCSHVYEPDATYPRRCLGCRVIDHGVTRAIASRTVGINNTINAGQMGEYLFGGGTIARGRERHDVSHLLDEPCEQGHVGERYVVATRLGKIGCRECERQSRNLWKNGVWKGHRTDA